jgi:glutamine synthetase
MLERFYSNRELILEKSLKFFKNSNSLIPKIGCELEFFLFEGVAAAGEVVVDEFILELQECYQAEKERGASQIEIKTDFTADLSALCRDLEDCKGVVRNLALKRGLTAVFAAQPFEDDCGNALQFNISLHDEGGENIFLTDEILLKEAAASLLSLTNFMMIFLAPNEDDYLRFSEELNIKLFKRGKFTAPVNLSFGGDNRSCAIRVVDVEEGKRLEYRVASANADPYLSVAAILIALTEKSPQGFERIFGNAFDEEYQLEELCSNLDEAKRLFFAENNVFLKGFSEFISPCRILAEDNLK